MAKMWKSSVWKASIGKRSLWQQMLVVVALLLVMASPLAARELIILQAGQEMGRAEQTVRIQGDTVSLMTHTSLFGGVEATTMFMFQGVGFPKQPLAYRLDLKSPGGAMVVDMRWQEAAVEYEIHGMGRQGELQGENILPLDNMALTDYAVLAWIFDEMAGQPESVLLNVPSQLPQGEMLVPLHLQFLGHDDVEGVETLAFTGDVGVPVHIWVDTQQRQLVKMTIPAQGIEITATEPPPPLDVERPWTQMGPYASADRDVEQVVPGAKLTGTLTLPLDAGPDLPGVVLIAGSGPTDRDGNSAMLPGRIDNLKDIAEYLASHGIAVLRYDKRGTGSSALLSQEIPSFQAFADDAAAMTELLAAEAAVDEQQLFFAGHSEGAVLALVAAEQFPGLAGLMLLSGPGRTMGETVRGQLEEQVEYLAGMDPEQYGQLPSELHRALDLAYAAIAAAEPVPYEEFQLPSEVTQFIQSLDMQRPFTKDWLITDPAALITALDLPILILHGLADSQVKPDHAYQLAAAQMAAHLVMVPGVDHVLKYSGDAIIPYQEPGRFVDERVLQAMVRFVQE